jgi:hypothetical protein
LAHPRLAKLILCLKTTKENFAIIGRTVTKIKKKQMSIFEIQNSIASFKKNEGIIFEPNHTPANERGMSAYVVEEFRKKYMLEDMPYDYFMVFKSEDIEEGEFKIKVKIIREALLSELEELETRKKRISEVLILAEKNGTISPPQKDTRS